MSIEHKEGLVEDYFAGVLQSEEKEAFERHVRTCPFCRERLEEVKRLDILLRRTLAYR